MALSSQRLIPKLSHAAWGTRTMHTPAPSASPACSGPQPIWITVLTPACPSRG